MKRRYLYGKYGAERDAKAKARKNGTKVDLIRTEENYSNAIAFTVSGDDVKMIITKFDEYIKAMIAPV